MQRRAVVDGARIHIRLADVEQHAHHRIVARRSRKVQRRVPVAVHHVDALAERQQTRTQRRIAALGGDVELVVLACVAQIDLDGDCDANTSAQRAEDRGQRAEGGRTVLGQDLEVTQQILLAPVLNVPQRHRGRLQGQAETRGYLLLCRAAAQTTARTVIDSCCQSLRSRS